MVAAVSPAAAERARSLDQYAGQLSVRSADSFSLAPELFGRSGAVAVAALLLLPLAAFAARRRWAAYVVGGSLAVFLITLVPWVFTPFSDVVSLSQSRRLVGFLPFGFAFAGGMTVLAALAGRFTAPRALAGGGHPCRHSTPARRSGHAPSEDGGGWRARRRTQASSSQVGWRRWGARRPPRHFPGDAAGRPGAEGVPSCRAEGAAAARP